MKSDLSDGMSNHSDFSNDSQNSHISNMDFLTIGGGILLTPTSVSIKSLLVCLPFMAFAKTIVVSGWCASFKSPAKRLRFLDNIYVCFKSP